MTDATTIAERVPPVEESRARLRELTPEHNTLAYRAREKIGRQLSWHLKVVAKTAMNAELERLVQS